MKKTKKLIAMLLAVMMLLSLLPVAAFAATNVLTVAFGNNASAEMTTGKTFSITVYNPLPTTQTISVNVTGNITGISSGTINLDRAGTASYNVKATAAGTVTIVMTAGTRSSTITLTVKAPHTHSFTGDFVQGSGENAGKHARKCSDNTCTAVGYMNGTTPVEGYVEHNFIKEVADVKYLKAPATYTKKAVYFKSCECGECDKSETAATFENGNTLTLAECYTNKVVEVNGLMGRQGLVTDNVVSQTQGRTIIGLTEQQLNAVENNLIIVGSDGNKQVNVTVDCVYTYFYNGSTKVETTGLKNTAGEDIAAFAIIDNDGTQNNDNTITGYGYYRVYNNSLDNFMFDTLYAAPEKK